MKTIIRSVALGFGLGLPGLGLAQGTFLADPADLSQHAVTVTPGGNVGVGTEAPWYRFHVDGNIGLGVVSTTAGEAAYGNILSFHGGPNTCYPEHDSENTDPLWIARYNAFCDQTELRVNVGGGIDSNDKFVIGTAGFLPLFEVRANGAVVVGPTGRRASVDVTGPIRTHETVAGSSAQFVAIGPADGTGQLVFSQGSDSEARGRIVYDFRDDRMTFRTSGIDDVVTFADDNVGIGTTTPAARLDVAGKVRCEVLELTSDRAVKDDVKSADPREVLRKVVNLRISTWHYTNAPIVRHIGPMAQDFKAAFGVGESDKHISVVDGLGVALAAIQGLNQKLEEQLAEKDARIAALERELNSLRSDVANRLAALEQSVSEPPLQRVNTTMIPSASLAVVGESH